MLTQDLIHVGRISGVFGIKGWLKITSYTEPRVNIARYRRWIVKKNNEQKLISVLAGQAHSRGVIVQLEDIDDRDHALAFIGWDIFITRDQLPPVEQDEYYWADLVGLQVKNTAGIPLGKVESLLETGANDVLVISGDRERAVPFIQGQIVKSIDLQSGMMIVDWDADF